MLRNSLVDLISVIFFFLVRKQLKRKGKNACFLSIREGHNVV